MNIKKILKMIDKTQLKESASMSITASGESAQEVSALIDLIKNAGIDSSNDIEFSTMPTSASSSSVTSPHKSSCGRNDITFEKYENEPDPQEKDIEYMTNTLSGGLNRRKKSFKKAEDGDNPMNVDKEKIKEGLLRLLEETKKKKAKKDYDKDGKIESPKDEYWGSRLKAAKTRKS